MNCQEGEFTAEWVGKPLEVGAVIEEDPCREQSPNGVGWVGKPQLVGPFLEDQEVRVLVGDYLFKYMWKEAKQMNSIKL